MTRNDDYCSTIEQLGEIRRGEIESTVQSADAKRNGFYAAIADIEEHGIEHLDRLKTEIQNDKLLLGIESRALLDLLEAERKALLDSLRQAVVFHEKQERK